MDSSTFMEILQNFETKKVMAYLKEMNLQELIKNPYFLGGTGLLAIIAFFMRWRLLMVTIISITGFVYLLSYTMSKGTSLESGVGSDSLMVFVGGGAFIVFAVIYLLFVSGE